MIRWYDMWGNEVSQAEAMVLWGKKMTDDYGRLGMDDIGPYWISTVWLATDHGYFGGPPVLWETMVFRKGSLQPLQTVRYTSAAMAVAGHDAIVNTWRAKVEETH